MKQLLNISAIYQPMAVSKQNYAFIGDNQGFDWYVGEHTTTGSSKNIVLES